MPTGYYLHLAIDDYCRKIRYCKEDDLLAQLYDAEDLNAAAVKGGFTKPFGLGKLADDNATGVNLLKAIEDNLQKLGSGDYLLVTFNGYGVQPEVNGALNSQYRGWLLGDGDFLLVDLFAALATAVTGVRILVVSCSCFSGTMRAQPKELSVPRILEVTKEHASELYSQKRSWTDLSLDKRRTDPSIYHLTACALNETVPDGFVSSQSKQHSPFVEDLLDLLGDGQQRTFTQFRDDLRAKRKDKSPQLEAVTAIETAFHDAGPFRVV